MQRLPCAPAQRAHGAVGGRQRQRQQQQPAGKADQDERPLEDVAADVGDLESHVQPAVGQQVQAGVEKHEQPEHAPIPRQLRRARVQPQRRDCQRQAQKSQRPVAQAANQRLSRVSTQLVGGGTPHQPGQRQQTEHEDQRLGQRVQQGGSEGHGEFRKSTAGRRGRKGFAEDAKESKEKFFKVFFCVLCEISASSASGCSAVRLFGYPTHRINSSCASPCPHTAAPPAPHSR